MLRFTAFFVFFLAINVAPSLGEIVKGGSRDLGIRFLVLGGSHWCGPQIKVRLTAPSASSFQPDEIPFLQMVGRIRAVVVSQCPGIEEITFDGVAKGRSVFAAETSRLTRWRQLINLDPATHRPACPLLSDYITCSAWVETYLIVHKLMRGSAFAETELTSVLQPGSNDLALRSGNVVGKLRITSRADLAMTFPTAGDFSAAILADIGNGCTKQGGAVEPIITQAYGPHLAQSELTCRPSDMPAAKNVVLVWASREQFRVFSLWAEDPALAEATSFADSLVKAMQSGR